jgi:hypothetical protein
MGGFIAGHCFGAKGGIKSKGTGESGKQTGAKYDATDSGIFYPILMGR